MKTVHIPLRGSVEIGPSILRGDTAFAFPIAGTAIPLVKSGKFRALAVTSGKPLGALPEVPTLAESLGNDLLVQETWFGLWAPAATSSVALRKLHSAALKALSDTALRAQFEATGSTVAFSKSPEEFTAFIKSEFGKWGEIVKLSGVIAE